jgi:hypothetical protein
MLSNALHCRSAGQIGKVQVQQNCFRIKLVGQFHAAFAAGGFHHAITLLFESKTNDPARSIVRLNQ